MTLERSSEDFIEIDSEDFTEIDSERIIDSGRASGTSLSFVASDVEV